jgi:putative transposase
MAGHVFHEIFLHINWHTKGDLPMLAGPMEKMIHDCITGRCKQTKGVYFHEIGGTDDHVHLVVDIEPFLTLSKWLGQIKGGSSHDINKQHGRTMLDWQRGYGIVSFGKRNLPWVLDYVRNQRAHHAKGTTQSRLEECPMDDEEPEGGIEKPG